MRKLIIGISALGVVVLLFLVYAMIMDTTPIEGPQVTDSQDLNLSEPSDQSGDTRRAVKKTDYYKYNPETKEIQAIYGFEKLLNPDTDQSRWEVENPYLLLYRSSFRCRIDSDTGTFQMETSGSNASPKDAQLNGNVLIHVIPEKPGKISETFIEMDDLTFSSERSEFATDGPVTIRSDQVFLKGVGMVLLVDTASGRIDYMQIRDLEILRIFETSPSANESPSKRTKTASATKPPAAATHTPADVPEDGSQEQEKAPSPEDYYQCILKDNVEITYGNELIVDSADEVSIQNVLLSQREQVARSQSDGEVKSVPAENKKAQSHPGQSVIASSNKETRPSQKEEPSKEVVVKCDGGIIFKPMGMNELPIASDTLDSELSVEMSGNPLQIARIVSDAQSGRQPLASCGLLTYTPIEDVLRLFTHEQQPEIIFTAQQSRNRIETLGNVWWNRKDRLANIAGPGKAYLSGTDAASEPTEVTFKGAMDLVFARSEDINASPSIETINLTGGMDAIFKQNGWYKMIADSALLKFGSENALSQATLQGQVEFNSMDTAKPQRAVADSATFKFGPQNSLRTAYMDGGVIFESVRDQQKTRALSETAMIYFDQNKIQTADLDGAVSFLSDTGTLTASHATVEFKPDQTGTMQPKSVLTTGQSTLETVSRPKDTPPAQFQARKIDYDLQTGSGLAHGPIRFMFYQPSDADKTATTDPWVPIVVTADENARFIADAAGTMKQVVFNGNVITSRRQNKQGFVQQDDLHGEKLIVDLDKGYVESMEISTITMTDGDVYAQSQRLKDDEIQSNIKLFCEEIIFNQTDDQIVATGPGEIRMNNSKAAGSKESSEGAGVDFSKPCYALIEGFNIIDWDLKKQTIIVDGQQDQLQLAYIPLVDGVPEKYIYVNSLRFDITLGEDMNGQTALKQLFTNRPMTYREKDQNNDKTLLDIDGQRMNYNATNGDGWLKIEGTEAVPAKINGFRTPYVLVHPASGKIKTSLSTLPGVLKSRQSKK